MDNQEKSILQNSMVSDQSEDHIAIVERIFSEIDKTGENGLTYKQFQEVLTT